MEKQVQRTASRRRPRAVSQPPRERYVIGAWGLLLAVFGAGLSWLALSASLASGHSVITIALVAALGAFIGLFGFSMALQAARDRPTSHGFFARWLMQVAGKASPFGVFATLVVFGTVALFAGSAFNLQHEAHDGARVLLTVLAYHLQVFFHELGHYLAARQCGYRPFRVVGGAFGFTRRAGGWTLHANEDWLFLAGGAVFYAAGPSVRTWARDMWVVAAGPLATALLVGICAQVAPAIADYDHVREFVEENTPLGVMLLIYNLLPMRLGVSKLATDGHRILELLRNRE